MAIIGPHSHVEGTGQSCVGATPFRRDKYPSFHSSPHPACFTHFLFNTPPPGVWIWDTDCGNLFKESIITFPITKCLKKWKDFPDGELLGQCGSKGTIPIFSHTPQSLLRFFLLPGKRINSVFLLLGKTYTNSSRLQEAFLDFLPWVLMSLPSVSIGILPLPLPSNLSHQIVCPWHPGHCLAGNIDNSVNILTDEWMNVLNHVSWHFLLLGVSVQ